MGKVYKRLKFLRKVLFYSKYVLITTGLLSSIYCILINEYLFAMGFIIIANIVETRVALEERIQQLEDNGGEVERAWNEGYKKGVSELEVFE